MPNYDLFYDEESNTFDTHALILELIKMEITMVCERCRTEFKDVPFNNGQGINIVSCPNCYMDIPI